MSCSNAFIVALITMQCLLLYELIDGADNKCWPQATILEMQYLILD